MCKINSIVKPDSVDLLTPILAKYKIAQEANRILYINFTSVVDYMWLLRAACECLAAFDKRAVLYLAAAVSDFYIPSDKMVIIHVMLITKLHDYGYFVIQHDLCDFLFSTFISQRTKYNLDTEPQRFPYNLCQKCWLHWSVYGFQMHSLFHSSWKPTRIC